MRNLTKYAVMIAMLIYALPVYGATARDNYVYFPGVSYFKWYDYDHKITDGQPWNFINSGMSDDSTGVIHIQAGRSGSEEVADWFRDRAEHAISTLPDPPSWPDKLNFVTWGHMILKDKNGRSAVCHNVVIGQGHTPTGYNNWWIGGDQMHRYGGKYWLVCPPRPDEGYCGAVVPIYPSQSRSNYITFKLWMCPPAVSLSLSSDVLWPADGKMHEIEATITGGDACGPSPYVELISVESNEPDSGLGNWDCENDIQEHEIGTDDRVFRLRAEHSKGGERVYTVTYLVIDGCDKETTIEATVTVPHDMGKNIHLKR